MNTKYTITGMTCEKCVAKVTQALSAVPGVQNVKVNLGNEEAEIVSDALIAISAVNDAVSAVGNYKAIPYKPKNLWKIFAKKVRKFLPLIIVFTIILTWSTAHQYLTGFSVHGWMLDFMGSFFLIFGGLKVVNWKKFAEGYSLYDPLARKFKVYAYVYPAIEIFLGIAYQFHFAGELFFNITTVVILSIATYGIIEKLSKGELVQCACLGGFFNIPISWFTIFENVIMIIMAIEMQIMLFSVWR